MKQLIKFVFACFVVVNSYAQNIQIIQETDLFTRTTDDVILSKPSFILINNQPSGNPNSLNMYHNYQLQSLNHHYNWQVKIMGQDGILETASHYYDYFDIIGNTDSVILRWYGQDMLTTTQELTHIKNRNNYFEKISLNSDSYALVFCGMRDSYSDVPGEMIIVVVNKNQAVVVYDDYASAISPTNFDSDTFAMYFLKDLSGLYNPNIEDYDTSPVNLGGRTFYRLRKDNGVLKIAQCRYTN